MSSSSLSSTVASDSTTSAVFVVPTSSVSTNSFLSRAKNFGLKDAIGNSVKREKKYPKAVIKSNVSPVVARITHVRATSIEDNNINSTQQQLQTTTPTTRNSNTQQQQQPTTTSPPEAMEMATEAAATATRMQSDSDLAQPTADESISSALQAGVPNVADVARRKFTATNSTPQPSHTHCNSNTFYLKVEDSAIVRLENNSESMSQDTAADGAAKQTQTDELSSIGHSANQPTVSDCPKEKIEMTMQLEKMKLQDEDKKYEEKQDDKMEEEKKEDDKADGERNVVIKKETTEDKSTTATIPPTSQPVPSSTQLASGATPLPFDDDAATHQRYLSFGGQQPKQRTQSYNTETTTTTSQQQTDTESVQISNCTLCHQPVLGSALELSDDAVFHHPQCANCPACQKCLDEGDVMRIKRMYYHEQCVKCRQCGISLVDKPLAVNDYSLYLYCAAHSGLAIRNCPDCHACHLSLNTSDQLVRTPTGELYHSLCVHCCVCHVGLAQSRVFVKEGKILCQQHFNQVTQHIDKCHTCQQPINSQQCIQLGSQLDDSILLFHVGCFRCQSCQCDLRQTSFLLHKHTILCQKDYEDAIRTLSQQQEKQKQEKLQQLQQHQISQIV